MEDIVIVAASRTAVGKFGGSLSKVAAPDLGATVIKNLLERTGLGADQVGEVILGQVLAAGSGPNRRASRSSRAAWPKKPRH